MFSQDKHDDVVAALEAAPFVAGKWDQGLDGLAAAGGGWAAQLLGVAGGDAIAFNLVTHMPADAVAEWERRGGAVADINPRAAALFARPLEIRGDDDFLSREDQQRSAFYHEVFAPCEADYASVARLNDHRQLRTALCIIHNRRQGHADAADHGRLAALLPHLDAALRLQLHLNHERIGATMDALDLVAMPAFMINQWERVIATTAAGDALLRRDHVLTLQGGKLAAVDRKRDGTFQAALRLAGHRPGAYTRHVRQTTLVLPDRHGTAWRVDVAPLPPETVHATSGATCLVTVAAPRPASNTLALLQESFGLTAAEAAVALDIAKGFSATEIGAIRGASANTVRVQINSVLHKTGLGKASALAALIGRLNL